eukprot:Sdes_comp16064_c0_seq2m5273
MEMFDELKRMNKRQVAFQIINFVMVVSSALMFWKGLIVFSNSESPIVVVLSGSMEPAFYRGDLLLLSNDLEERVDIGEIVVFKIRDREIPIVHRVIKIHEGFVFPPLISHFSLSLPHHHHSFLFSTNGQIKYLTKGD